MRKVLSGQEIISIFFFFNLLDVLVSKFLLFYSFKLTQLFLLVSSHRMSGLIWVKGNGEEKDKAEKIQILQIRRKRN